MGNRDDKNVSAAWYLRCIRVIACSVCWDDLALWQSYVALRANGNNKVLADGRGCQ